MNNKIILLAAVGGVSVATGASALPLSSFQSDNGVIEARWAEAYPGNVAPRFEGGSVYICTTAICMIPQRVATMIAIAAGG